MCSSQKIKKLKTQKLLRKSPSQRAAEIWADATAQRESERRHITAAAVGCLWRHGERFPAVCFPSEGRALSLVPPSLPPQCEAEPLAVYLEYLLNPLVAFGEGRWAPPPVAPQWHRNAGLMTPVQASVH